MDDSLPPRTATPGASPPLPPEDCAVMRRFLFEVCNASPEIRADFANTMGLVRRQLFRDLADPPSFEAAALARQLKATGIARLGALVDDDRCAEIRDYFRARPAYAGHVVHGSDGVPRSLDETRTMSHYGCHARADVMRCPHLVEIANDPRLLQIAEAYLGCPPTIYTLHAWWSFAQQGTAAAYSQSLHRDMDELRFVTLFIYLTPVTERTGAHRYITHSHDKAALIGALAAQGLSQDAIDAALTVLFRGPGYEMSDMADTLVGPLATVWIGSAGSAILADTYGLHMGLPLLEGERLMVWVRYGLGMLPFPEFGDGSGQYAETLRQRIPATARARYVNRLLLTE